MGTGDFTMQPDTQHYGWQPGDVAVDRRDYTQYRVLSEPRSGIISGEDSVFVRDEDGNHYDVLMAPLFTPQELRLRDYRETQSVPASMQEPSDQPHQGDARPLVSLALWVVGGAVVLLLIGG